MAGSLTQWGESLLLNYAIGREEPVAANSPTAGLFLGLVQNTDLISETGEQPAFQEVSYTGYKRQALIPERWDAVNATGTASKVIYQDPIRFPAYTGTTILIVRYIVLYTQSIGGLPVWYSRLDANGNVGRALETGDIVLIKQNELVLSID